MKIPNCSGGRSASSGQLRWMWFPGCSVLQLLCESWFSGGKCVRWAVSLQWRRSQSILGLEATASEPKVAVVRCNGTCANRPKLTQYDGVRSCVVVILLGGETGCTFGCLGCGDCVSACQFDAIHMNPETGLPEVMNESKCTACGACSKACPRNIEIRPKGKNNRQRVYVQCVNKDKGAVARKGMCSSFVSDLWQVCEGLSV